MRVVVVEVGECLPIVKVLANKIGKFWLDKPIIKRVAMMLFKFFTIIFFTKAYKVKIFLKSGRVAFDILSE